MDEQLILSNGAVLNYSHAIASGGELDLYVADPGVTMDILYGLLSKPENTARITARRYGDEAVYDGYTDFYTITRERDQITAALKGRPANV